MSRGTESEESLNARVSKAAYEISFKTYFNKTIVNSNLENACREAEEIIVKFLHQQ